MSKAYIKRSIIICLFICLILSFSSCLDVLGAIFGGYAPPPIDDSEHVDYISEYTQEEHILRISETTRIHTGKYWNSMFLFLRDYNDGISANDVQLKDFTVEVVYSIYDNDPEYFLVQIKVKKKANVENLDIPTGKWYLGMIRNDRYYIWQDGVGENPYLESGNGGAKKYFGNGHYAVDTGDGVLKELKYNYDTDGWNMVALTKDEKSTYGEYNELHGGLTGYSGVMQEHVDYYSLYPERTHVVNLSQTTEKLFQGKYCPELGYLGEMNLESYRVETMYSVYDNDPEYCLIQVNLQAPIEIEAEHLFADQLWYIILIQNEKYYIFDWGYGLNPYEASGFGESVKYHAFGHYAVQTGENELTEVIYNEETGVWEKRVLTDAEKRIYGEYNDASDCDLYYKK